MTPDQRTLALRIALTVSAIEFFGPAIRDAGASHALNPDWVGHARLLDALFNFSISIELLCDPNFEYTECP